MYLEKVCAVPKMLSSTRGKLDVIRHLISGADWATAGAAIAPATKAPADPVRNCRRFNAMGKPHAVCRVVLVAAGYANREYAATVLRGHNSHLSGVSVAGFPEHRRPGSPPKSVRSKAWPMDRLRVSSF